VLEHSHAHDAIIGARDVAEVGQPDLDVSGEAGLRDPAGRALGVSPAERDAGAARPILAGGEDEEPAEAAADVVQAVLLKLFDFV
jgi:hypothetical protein